jgi:DNA segregation ATPase FtsK/SpoIIIE-like protein
MVDEVNMLTGNKDIIDALTKLGQGTRKYGIYCIVGGQNWNASDIPTKLRDNFSTRIQMRAMSRSQSNVMIADGAAADIVNHGRAYVVIPGRIMAEVQTPYISKVDIINALTGRSGPKPTMPEPLEVAEPEPTEIEAKAIEAYKEIRDGEKFSWRKATEAAYGSGVFGKHPNDKLRATLTKFNIDY